MSYYGGTITAPGRNLIITLLAGEKIQYTRIVVGKGFLPDGVEPADVTDLIDPVAEGTSTVPTVENGYLNMTVEYRNDMNGGLEEKFWLSEFGIYAKTENSEEVLFYYATLGDSPQPVNPYKENMVDIRRYPISVEVTLGSDDVEVLYNPGAFITAADAQTIIQSIVTTAIDSVKTSIVYIPETETLVFSNTSSGGSSGTGTYTLPIASEDTLGGVRIGEDMNIDSTGRISPETEEITGEEIRGLFEG